MLKLLVMAVVREVSYTLTAENLYGLHHRAAAFL